MSKVFKTSVRGVGPWCIEFADGEIVTTCNKERADSIAATEPVSSENESPVASAQGAGEAAKLAVKILVKLTGPNPFADQAQWVSALIQRALDSARGEALETAKNNLKEAEIFWNEDAIKRAGINGIDAANTARSEGKAAAFKEASKRLDALTPSSVLRDRELREIEIREDEIRCAPHKWECASLVVWDSMYKRPVNPIAPCNCWKSQRAAALAQRKAELRKQGATGAGKG